MFKVIFEKSIEVYRTDTPYIGQIAKYPLYLSRYDKKLAVGEGYCSIISLTYGSFLRHTRGYAKRRTYSRENREQNLNDEFPSFFFHDCVGFKESKKVRDKKVRREKHEVRK